MSQQHAFSNKSQWGGGYVALISVLVISAVGVIIAISLLTLGNISEQSSYALQQKYSAEALASACANKALEVIRLLASYSGDESVYIDDNHCDILPVTKDGGVYIVKVEGVIGDVVQRTEVVVFRFEDPDTSTVTMTLQSWRDVADF